MSDGFTLRAEDYTPEARIASAAEMFRNLAELIEAGIIVDAAYVCLGKVADEPPMMGFAAEPVDQPERLVAALKEITEFAGNTKAHDDLRAARAKLAAGDFSEVEAPRNIGG